MNVRLIAAGLLAGAAAVTGCADPKSFCGNGTQLEENLCVPIPVATCPTGQARIEGTCRPICGSNTVDTATGCVVAEGACGAGTVIKDGACKVIDPMERVQVRESVEPNFDPAKGSTFELPAEGADAVVLGGSVGSVTPTGGDFDAFVFKADAGTRIRVSALAVGAPSVAARVYPLGATDKAQAEQLSSYVISGTSRTALREVNLPIGGDWAIEVSAPSNYAMVGGIPVGADGFTYTVDVSRVAAITGGVNLGAGATGGGKWEAGGVFNVAGNGTSLSLFEASLGVPEGQLPFNGLRRLVATDKQHKLLAVATDNLKNSGELVPMASKVRFVVPADGATILVDYIAALDVSGLFEIKGNAGEVDEVGQVPAGNIPGSLAEDGLQVFGFTVPAISKLAVNFAKPAGSKIGSFHCELRDATFNLIDEVTSASGSSTLDALVTTESKFFVVCDDKNFDATVTGDYSFTMNVAINPVVDLGQLGAGASVDNASMPATLTVPSGASASASKKVLAAFNLTKEAFVNIYARPVTATTKVTLSLRNTAWKELAYVGSYSAVPPPGGPSNGNSVGPQFLAPGFYVIECTESYSSSSGGDVAFEVVSQSATLIDENEPNNSNATAQMIAFDAAGTYVKGGHQSANDQKDYFHFDVASAGTLSVKTLEFGTNSTNTFIVRLRAVGASTTLDTETTYYDAVTDLSASVQPGSYEIEVEYDYDPYYDPYYDPAPPVSPIGTYMFAISLK